jgi:hypothetical protein
MKPVEVRLKETERKYSQVQFSKNSIVVQIDITQTYENAYRWCEMTKEITNHQVRAKKKSRSAGHRSKKFYTLFGQQINISMFVLKKM